MCEWRWHVSEWVMALLLYVFSQRTFKAVIETVKGTYWLQPLTRYTQWLPIFHLSETLWSLCAGGGCSSRCSDSLEWHCQCVLYAQAQGRWTQSDWQSDTGQREKREQSKFSTTDSGPGDSSPGGTCLLLSPRDESLIAGKASAGLEHWFQMSLS